MRGRQTVGEKEVADMRDERLRQDVEHEQGHQAADGSRHGGIPQAPRRGGEEGKERETIKDEDKEDDSQGLDAELGHGQIRSAIKDIDQGHPVAHCPEGRHRPQA